MYAVYFFCVQETLRNDWLVFARTDYDGPQLTNLVDIIHHVKPTALLGLSTAKVSILECAPPFSSCSHALERVHRGGRQGHVHAEPATHPLPPLQPGPPQRTRLPRRCHVVSTNARVPMRASCSSSPSQDRRQRHLRVREPIRARDTRWDAVRTWTGQQHVHLPRHRSRCDSRPDAPRLGQDGRTSGGRPRVVARRRGACGGTGVPPSDAHSRAQYEDCVGGRATGAKGGTWARCGAGVCVIDARGWYRDWTPTVISALCLTTTCSGSFKIKCGGHRRRSCGLFPVSKTGGNVRCGLRRFVRNDGEATERWNKHG